MYYSVYVAGGGAEQGGRKKGRSEAEAEDPEDG
jgi:hypothetical protein